MGHPYPRGYWAARCRPFQQSPPLKSSAQSEDSQQKTPRTRRNGHDRKTREESYTATHTPDDHSTDRVWGQMAYEESIPWKASEKTLLVACWQSPRRRTHQFPTRWLLCVLSNK